MALGVGFLGYELAQQARKPDALTAVRGKGALRWLCQLRRRLRESLG